MATTNPPVPVASCLGIPVNPSEAVVWGQLGDAGKDQIPNWDPKQLS